MKENAIPFNRKEKVKLNDLLKIVMHIKNMVHCAYDSLFIANSKNEIIDLIDLDLMKSIVVKLEEIDFLNVKKSTHSIDYSTNDSCTRMHQNVRLMAQGCESILSIYNNLD